MRFTLLLIFVIAFTQINAQYELEKLGPEINTEHMECYPKLTPDGKTLFFSRKISGHYDIYESHLDENNKWTKAVKIDKLNNGKDNEVCYITPDGNTLWLSGTYGNDPNEDGFSLSYKTEDGWSDPVSLEIEGTDGMWGNHNAAPSSDGKTMILSLESDLWVSFNKNGKWQKPIKLPDNLNTSTNEYTPFLAADNKTLYFSSGGHGGLGSNDIFKTTRLDDTWLKWSEPENVGKPVNSSRWETFFSISAHGNQAIVYRLDGGDGNLYTTPLAEEVRPEPILLVKGKVFNGKTKEAINASVQFEDIANGEIIGTAKTNPETKVYTIVLTPGKKYGVRADAEGFFGQNEFVDLTELAEYTEVEKNLTLSPVEVGQTIRLNNIFFDTGKDVLKPESFAELNRVVKFLQDNPEIKIEIAGHTDNVGSETSNKALSQKRANAVTNYIIGNGIDKLRLKSVGYGESKPVASNSTDEGKQQNRRVEFTLLETKTKK